MKERYVTVKCEGEAEIVEKKSRFIAHVKPIKTHIEAAEYIEAIKKKYWDARHNCTAFRLGNGIERYNDDGEPGGTAGMPILDVLRGRDIVDAVVVVTRYFGGTLLGTGGLVRAYTKSSSIGIKAAGLIEKTLNNQLHIITDYTLSGKIQYEALNKGHIIKNTIYTHNVEYVILCEYDKTDQFIKNIINVTNGKASVTKGDCCYIDKDIEF